MKNRHLPSRSMKKEEPAVKEQGGFKKAIIDVGTYFGGIIMDCISTTARDLIMGEVDKHFGQYRKNRYGGYGTNRQIGFRDFDDENWNRRG